MRKCDGCTLCCTLMAVDELHKPPKVKCKYEGNKCCSIYETRPPSCRTFNCLWLQHDAIPEFMKPDKSGIVLTTLSREDSADPMNIVVLRAPYTTGDAEKYLVNLGKSITMITGRKNIRDDFRKRK